MRAGVNLDYGEQPQHIGLELDNTGCAVHTIHRRVDAHHLWSHARLYSISILPCGADQLPVFPFGSGAGDVMWSDATDAGAIHQFGFERAPHQYSRQGSDFNCSIPAIDVSAGVGLSDSDRLGISDCTLEHLTGL